MICRNFCQGQHRRTTLRLKLSFPLLIRRLFCPVALEGTQQAVSRRVPAEQATRSPSSPRHPGLTIRQRRITMRDNARHEQE